MIPYPFQEDVTNLARPIFTPAGSKNMLFVVLFVHASP